MSWPACGLIASCSGSKLPTKYTVDRGLPFCDFAAKYIPHGYMGCGIDRGTAAAADLIPTCQSTNY